MDLNELIGQRLQKLQNLVLSGQNPYHIEKFDRSLTIKELVENFSDGRQVQLAGRLSAKRKHGKVCFADLRDQDGRIQLYVRLGDGLNEQEFEIFNHLDIGDIIGVSGYVFTTKTGEISIHVTTLKMLSKALKPLPIVKTDESGNSFDEVSDPEFRYRQRYVDLIINPQVRETFKKRSQIINSIRQTLINSGALEVETPILQSIPGGATARPFVTHHNALNMPLYLRIANELFLKRLIVGGFDGVFEFAKDFRNEGMDRTHNPEFTVLEFYIAYKDYNWMMNFTEQMLEKTAIAVNGVSSVLVGDNDISFKAPYKRITMYDAIKEHTGFDISEMDEEGIRNVCQQLGIHANEKWGKGKLIDEIFGEKCEAKYIQPTFITDYPVEMSPLTKKHRSKPGLVERFELMVNGKEIATPIPN